ncbi:MAG: hypothetical protein ACI32C_04335 [Candidatus Enteromonas sp.]
MTKEEKGFHMSVNEDGTLHVTDYYSDGDEGIRYSRDMDENGELTNRHIVDQSDKEKLNLPDCKIEDDELD